MGPIHRQAGRRSFREEQGRIRASEEEEEEAAQQQEEEEEEEEEEDAEEPGGHTLPNMD